MSGSIVVQSCAPGPAAWVRRCLQSVRDWATACGHEYQFLGDELFDRISPALLARTLRQPLIATDLARLRVLQELLAAGADCVVWLDADFLIFDPDRFRLPDADCAVGREVWVQPDPAGDGFRVYRKVHNALLMFRRGNTLLDFYAASATRLLSANQGRMPAQFIGPKLLTALHNVVQLPVMECAAMLSPWVIRDLLAGGGPALDLFRRRSRTAPAGANLCSSSVVRGELDADEMARVSTALLHNGLAIGTRPST